MSGVGARARAPLISTLVGCHPIAGLRNRLLCCGPPRATSAIVVCRAPGGVHVLRASLGSPSPLMMHPGAVRRRTGNPHPQDQPAPALREDAASCRRSIPTLMILDRQAPAGARCPAIGQSDTAWRTWGAAAWLAFRQRRSLMRWLHNAIRTQACRPLDTSLELSLTGPLGRPQYSVQFAPGVPPRFVPEA